MPPRERPYRNRVPAQYLHEFMIDEQGQMRHIRSGLKVGQFELTGHRPDGRRVLMKFNPTQVGWDGFWLTKLTDEGRWARLTNNERVPITRQSVKH